MKTLADFKRLLRPGQIWHAFNHPMNKDMGDRQICQVKSNAITFVTERGESWLYFPKAKDFKIVDDKTCQIYEGDSLILTYTLKEK